MARLDFSPAELDAVSTALHLSPWRFPFTVPTFGGQGRESRYAAVKGTLESRGLIEGARFAPVVENTLTDFANGPVSIAINGMTDRQAVIAVVVLRGKRAVLAIDRHDRITFQTMPAERAVQAAVTVLPALRPGPGGSITITAGRAPSGRPDTDSFGGHSYLRSARPATDHDSRAADQLLTRPRVGGGGFLITSTARPDLRESVSWLDTDAGRHAVTRTTASDGTVHVTFTPADHARLDQLITRALRKFT